MVIVEKIKKYLKIQVGKMSQVKLIKNSFCTTIVIIKIFQVNNNFNIFIKFFRH